MFYSVLFCSFVSDVVNIYYASDEVVQQDEEIQAFVKDVCNFGLQDFDSCGKLDRRAGVLVHDQLMMFSLGGFLHYNTSSSGRAFCKTILHQEHLHNNGC